MVESVGVTGNGWCYMDAYGCYGYGGVWLQVGKSVGMDGMLGCGWLLPIIQVWLA